MPRPLQRAALAALFAALIQPHASAAADRPAAYPTKPVRLIIANTTGTSVDTLARVRTPAPASRAISPACCSRI